MTTRFGLRHFFFCVVLFSLITLVSVHFLLDTALLNLLAGGILLIWFNPTELNFNQRFGLLVLLLTEVIFCYFIKPQAGGTWLFFILIGYCFGLKRHEINQTTEGYLLIWAAAFFHLSFVTNTKITDVQYDFASCYNYIEYILENNLLFWRENPLLTRPSYSTYHPILHFLTAAGVMRLWMWLGAVKETAGEALQVLFVSYMMWYGLIAARILRLFSLSRISYLSLLAMVVFFPAYTAISGFFNNDCLLLPLQAGAVYYGLCYYFNGDKKNLWRIFLFMTAAALTKLSGVLILPFIGAVVGLRFYQTRDIKTLKDLAIFGVVLFLGLMIWPLYQHYMLKVDFSFVPPQKHLGFEGYGLGERFSPLGAFVYTQRYYNDFGVNLWETLTKTALFGQWDFSVRGATIEPFITALIVCYKMILGLVCGGIFYLLWRAKDKKMLFLSLIFGGSLILGLVVFLIKNPYMCNQDFRYIAVLPLFFALILAQMLQISGQKGRFFCCFLLFLFAFLAFFVWNWVAF